MPAPLICLGILFFLTGSSIACFLNPTKLAKKTKGTEIPNHGITRADIVPNVTALDDFTPPPPPRPHMRAFDTKSIDKDNSREHECFFDGDFLPLNYQLNILYSRAVE
ncbi:hypothetical protein MRB53_009909 [Persea americana]|uniref:Uncharacterized protein n=1 Tax=Persea americana TaxID=3435 RepID=A0ACC2LRD3_PERAE|nr:hypothetical protein MRB53_009909 [Persea americana]